MDKVDNNGNENGSGRGSGGGDVRIDGRNWSRRGLYLLSAVLVLALAFAVAADWLALPRQQVTPAETRDGLPAVKWLDATLWFGDQDAQLLLPEKRRLRLDGTTAPEAVVEALIAGPTLPGRTETIPPGTRLLGIQVSGGIATVDFSREIQTNHWGGSAGELMTTYSVVNSLTQLPGIGAVQFLVEGQKLESIWGHGDTSKPIERNTALLGQP